jgi:hypothetical protein
MGRGKCLGRQNYTEKGWCTGRELYGKGKPRGEGELLGERELQGEREFLEESELHGEGEEQGERVLQGKRELHYGEGAARGKMGASRERRSVTMD